MISTGNVLIVVSTSEFEVKPMNIPDQLSEVDILLADDGFVSVLK